MSSPLDQPVPETKVRRAESFAKELAWLHEQGSYGVRFYYFNQIDLQDNVEYWGLGSSDLKETPTSPPDILKNRWTRDLLPSPELLQEFGYLSHVGGDVFLHMTGQEEYAQVYRLTPKAFKLLERSIGTYEVFISYRRRESSALALLIQARLNLVGNNHVFVDHLLELGGDWRTELEEKIRESDYFIVLVGTNTFKESPGRTNWMKRELEIAMDSNSRIVPIWLPSAKRNKTTPKIIGDRQDLKVQRKTAEGYDTAIRKLLNHMGYSIP